MHQRRLTPEQARFIVDLKRLRISNVEIAHKLGISEGAVRYRIKRHKSGQEDRRRYKYSQLNSFHECIDSWIKDYQDSTRRPTLKALYQLLKDYHRYLSSYDTPLSSSSFLYSSKNCILL